MTSAAGMTPTPAVLSIRCRKMPRLDRQSHLVSNAAIFYREHPVSANDLPAKPLPHRIDSAFTHFRQGTDHREVRQMGTVRLCRGTSDGPDVNALWINSADM
ncbi:hypothetical protein [Azospirillum thiophilum]|uniref:hypothetical protein n=1 Tax=Azospirillum thiophilum TaxID=528244 RepID=UPI0011877381|nr:hypothetical protein [Azospirillum thiophilum]